MRFRVAALALIMLGTLSFLWVTHRADRRQRASQARVTALAQPAAIAANPGRIALRQAIEDLEQSRLGMLVFGLAALNGLVFLLLVDRESSAVRHLLIAAPPVMTAVLALGHAVSTLALFGLAVAYLTCNGASLLLRASD